MADPYLGEIRIFGGNYAPRDWALCNGQVLPISQNQALFSILGTTYGGNGTTTFALPDLQGRVPLGMGQGRGLSDRPIGQSGGAENVVLKLSEIPAHRHELRASNAAQSTDRPAGAALSAGGYYTSQNPATAMNPDSVSPEGGSEPHPNVQPFLALTFIIALTGIYPSRA